MVDFAVSFGVFGEEESVALDLMAVIDLTEGILSTDVMAWIAI